MAGSWQDRAPIALTKLVLLLVKSAGTYLVYMDHQINVRQAVLLWPLSSGGSVLVKNRAVLGEHALTRARHGHRAPRWSHSSDTLQTTVKSSAARQARIGSSGIAI